VWPSTFRSTVIVVRGGFAAPRVELKLDAYLLSNRP
jgi:hypothetical protein